MNFHPFPIIETQNLILRRMTQDDAMDLFKMRRDSSMIQFTDSKLDETQEETKIYIDKMNKGIDENKWIIWAMEHRQSKKVIGSISIWNLSSEKASGELGFGIIPLYQGKGLMKEALLNVIKYGFEAMKLKMLEAYTEEKNQSSIHLLENCNFKEVDRVEEAGYFSKRFFRMVVYQLGRP